MITNQIFLGIIGPQQLIPILIVVLLLFGGKKIPELMKGLGNGIKEFKNATKDDDSETSISEENSDKQEKLAQEEKIKALEKEVKELSEKKSEEKAES